MRLWLVSSSLVLGLLSAAGAFAQPGVGKAGGGSIVGAPEARQAFVDAILAKWSPFVSETYGTPGDQWAANMSQVLANASLDALAEAARARSFAAMNDLLLGGAKSAPEASTDSVAKLGDTAIDLVFVPVTPCRIIDTRVAGGTITGGTTRAFDVTAISSYAGQGGDATDCGTGTQGSFAAAVINFTVVTPSGPGYITAWPYLASQPLAATLNYVAGDIRGNLAIVKLDQGASADELNVYTQATTHLVADIVGFFIDPQATDPECTATSISTFSIGASATSFFNNPACPTGYKATTPYCWTAAAGVYSQGSGYNANNAANATFCSWQNTTGASQTVFGGNVCCRVPGR